MGLLLVLVFAAVIISCGEAGSSTSAGPAGANTLVNPRDGIYKSKGKVTKVDRELGSVELDHEDIPGLMPAMIMEFFVKDKVILDGVERGDNVYFDIEHKHPSETVVRIEKIK